VTQHSITLIKEATLDIEFQISNQLKRKKTKETNCQLKNPARTMYTVGLWLAFINMGP